MHFLRLIHSITPFNLFNHSWVDLVPASGALNKKRLITITKTIDVQGKKQLC